MRAFFSYSHQDAQIVRAVADLVARPFVAIDTYEFRLGDDLAEAMERAVSEAALFVLFVSRAALNSPYVRHETALARDSSITGRIKKIAVVILDDRIGPDDLPPWLRNRKFITSNAAHPIARMVRGLLDEMVEDAQRGLFVGRGREYSQLQAALVPVGRPGQKSLVAVTGLPGIGRRTLLLRVARASLPVDRLLILPVEPGDSANDLAAKLGDIMGYSATPAEAVAQARKTIESCEQVALKSIVHDTADQERSLLVLFDEGGLLDNSGAPNEGVRAVLQILLGSARDLVTVVTNRRPSWSAVPDVDEAYTVAVPPLSDAEIRQLIALIARARGVELDHVQIKEMAAQVHGYPPAATAITELARSYGPALAAAPGALAKSYSPRPLLRYLQAHRPAAAELRLLRILASNSPLPVPVLAQLLGKGEAAAGRALTALIDASLVVPDLDTGWYRIAGPIAGHVERTYRPCSKEQYRAVAAALHDFLDTDRDGRGYLELERVRFRALWLSGARPEAFALAADWIRVAERSYHDRDYERCLKAAEMLHGERPDNSTVLEWMAKAQVRLERFDEAEHTISKVRTRVGAREAEYLHGFLERGRGRHGQAIRHYELALQRGYGGLAIHRDLAECYLAIGEPAKASKHIAEAHAKDPGNRYVLEIWLKVSCADQDSGEETARQLLAQLLPQLEPREQALAMYYRSRVEYAFGKIGQALSYALAAVTAGGDRPTLEVLANAALCALGNGQAAEALELIERMDAMYGNRRKDLQTALRVRHAIAGRQFEDAYARCRDFRVKDAPVPLTLEREALAGLLPYTNSTATRMSYENRIQAIEMRLATEFDKMSTEIDPDQT